MPDQAACDALRSYLGALYTRSSERALVELRFMTTGGITRSFHAVGEREAIGDAVLARAESADVYVGVLARRRRAGGRGDVIPTPSVVWVDCDGPQAVERLERFVPSPAVVVRSGSGQNCHAYWLLDRAVSVAQLERANRRLAWTLAGDLSCAHPATILRPPASVNHKHHAPCAVTLERCEPDRRVVLREVIGDLADPPGAARARSRGVRHPRSVRDPLREVAPARYVEVLTGERVSHDGKVRCPFHEDEKPSLHVYSDPVRGWYCFGCRRGGSIYDFAALLWKRSLRGAEFLALRRDLTAVLEGGRR